LDTVEEAMLEAEKYFIRVKSCNFCCEDVTFQK
jgi:hypothetical protein